MSDIKEILQQLDPSDDSHWTADGLPAVDAVKLMGAEDAERGDIMEAAPSFTRQHRSFDPPSDVKDPPAETPPAEDPSGQQVMPAAEFGSGRPPAPRPAVRSEPERPMTAEERVAERHKRDVALSKARNALQAATKAKRHADAQYKLAHDAYDKLQVSIKGPKTPRENQLTIQRYLQSTSGRPARSKLDQVMARPERPGIGESRPSRG